MNCKNNISVLVALLILSAQGSAPITTATLYAAVKDSSDAAVPNATIRLQEERTGVARSQVTDIVGESAFTFVAIGNYTLVISAPGFKTLTVSGLKLDAGQNESRKFVLDI